MLAASDVILVGAETLTPFETRTIEEKKIARITLNEVNADPAAAAARAVAWGAGFDRLLVHLDLDVMNFTAFPIADNVRYERRDGGFSLEETATLLKRLVAAPNWRALTVTEVNPDHAPNEAETFRHLITVLADALSQ